MHIFEWISLDTQTYKTKKAQEIFACHLELEYSCLVLLNFGFAAANKKPLNFLESEFRYSLPGSNSKLKPNIACYGLFWPQHVLY